jgi:hypothetical protein
MRVGREHGCRERIERFDHRRTRRTRRDVRGPGFAADLCNRVIGRIDDDLARPAP